MFFTGIFSAQVSGSLIDPADLVVNPLDPNGNGFVTFTGLQFRGAYDQSEFEIPFLALQQFKPESGPDNQFLMACELYELVSDAASNAYPGYYYFSIAEGMRTIETKMARSGKVEGLFCISPRLWISNGSQALNCETLGT